METTSQAQAADFLPLSGHVRKLIVTRRSKNKNTLTQRVRRRGHRHFKSQEGSSGLVRAINLGKAKEAMWDSTCDIISNLSAQSSNW